ncbi:hypothetical protein UlMin_025598 [Ulmus minor]
MRMQEKMFMKSQYFPPLMNSLSSSWEEKAFAEDAASGSIGGCIWPPRSYSCSFCMREFRSAQALGGHMNIHRRDRARLKQTLISPNLDNTNISNHLHQNPNSSSNSSPRVSSPSCSKEKLVNISQHHFLLPFSSSSSFPPRWKPEQGEEDDYVETNLAVGLNSSRSRQNGFCGGESNACKRPKTTTTLPLQLVLKHCHLQPEAIELKVASMDDLDLELRLGNPTKVK